MGHVIDQAVIGVFCGPCHGSGGLLESSVGRAMAQTGYSNLLCAVPWLRLLFTSL